MSTNKTLFQEAIADAKAVREAALANAKAALEETMTPRLQSMLAARLEENYEEGMGDTSFDTEEKTNMEEDLDLSEILAELENESQLEEAKKKGKKDEEEEDEEEDEVENEDDEEYSPEVENEEEARPTEIKDMNVEELLDLVMDKLEGKIADIVQQEMGTEASADKAEEPEMGMNPIGSEPASAGEEEININELLAELDAMYEGDEENPNLKEIDMNIVGPALGVTLPGIVAAWLMIKSNFNSVRDQLAKQKGVKPEEVSKEEVKQATAQALKASMDKTTGANEGYTSKREMNEAIRTIKTLRSELNEVNLLNAKLIYVNKIFKSKSLTEAQKIQVITSFDKATTTREAKVVFESLTTALAAPKKPLKESYGFASRAAGLAPRKQIVESNDVVARMQKLANIIK